MKSIEVLLLSRNDVVELALTPREVVSVVELALREHAEGTYEMHPKIGVQLAFNNVTITAFGILSGRHAISSAPSNEGSHARPHVAG